MNEGTVVQCIGAVIDVEFSREQLPKIYDALTLEGTDLTLEVQQQIGDGVVRTICATIDEVATMIVYLCSPLASATTGAAIRVDGGVVRAIL